MFQLLHRATGAENVAGWLVSEKLDGWRAAWIASKGHFITRGNKILTPPQWWTAGAPSVDLDGELWAGRGNLAVVKSLAGDCPKWEAIRFQSFGRLVPQPFFDTINTAAAGSFDCVLQSPACDWEHVAAFYAKIISSGGEGVVIRDPAALVTPGRSRSVLKIKPRPWHEGNPSREHWTAQ